MGALGGFYITNQGRALQAKAQIGTPLQYTKVMVGDGNLGGQSIGNLTGLISPKLTLPIIGLKTQSGGKALVQTVLSNQDVTTGFYLREMGVFALDPDLGEILYCYANAGSGAEYIPAGGGADVVEQKYNIFTLIGNAANVSAVIDQSVIYATLAELQEVQDELVSHKNATLVHGATDAATPNRIVQRDANGQFEVGAPTAANHVARKTDLDAHAAITNGAHGATSAATANRIVQRDANGRAKFAAPSADDDAARKVDVDAVQVNLNAHAAATTNIHGATHLGNANKLMIRDANGRAKVGPPAAADDIARKAEVDAARDASVNKIAVYNGSNGIDPNTTTDAYILTSHANTPSGDSKFWHIRTLFYQDTASGRAQIAQSYQGSDEMYVRHYHQSDGWTPWQRLWHAGNHGGSGDPHTQYVKKAGDTMTGNLEIAGNLPAVNIKVTNDNQTAVSGINHRDSASVQKFSVGYSASGNTWNIYNHTTARSSLIIYGATDNILFRGIGEFANGGGSLRLKPGSADHTYMEFFARTSNPDARSGYIGYPNTGGTHLAVKNQIGDIYLDPINGGTVYTGRLSVNNQTIIETNGDIKIRGTTLAPTRVNGGVLQYWNGSAWVDAGKRRAGGTADATFNAGYAKLSIRGLSFTPKFVFAMDFYNYYFIATIANASPINADTGTWYNHFEYIGSANAYLARTSSVGSGANQFQIVSGGFDIITHYSQYSSTGQTERVYWMAFE
ncbi:phage tail protein [Paenibacillus cisolokensis]|uniref:phage tail-collar fiber domain-containing protein n=1 Tax=Paenibacillus cisolokensis TaxID=1658519 RepID=UPI003D2E7A7D